jgi:DNA-binding LytR/AlgR family response regulator
MTVIIIEDEIPAGIRLERLLKLYSFDVLTILKSVKKALIWFEENNHPDIVFMDIKLNDGNCFDILNQIKINSKIVFTTAFDEFALKAFNYNSIDYLLKPINDKKLERLISKIDSLEIGFQSQNRLEIFTEEIKVNSYLVYSGTKIKKIILDDVLLFFSENNATYILTKENRNFLINKSLEKIENEIALDVFFRINRKYIINKKYINSIKKATSIILSLYGLESETFEVSKSKSKTFIEWYSK